MAKRNKIPTSEKLKIVNRIKTGESLNKVSRESGYQRCQIRNWLKNEIQLTKLTSNCCRIKGGGRKTFFPTIESEIVKWFKIQRYNKMTVSYSSFKIKAIAIAKDQNVNANEFKCSNKWIRGVCKRNKISSRKITHQSQQCLEINNVSFEIINKYLQECRQKTVGLNSWQIFNMDETPCYFDMCSDRTLHYKGERNIEGYTTGHTKSRFTTVLCIAADGMAIKTLIIFKGLKNIPKLILPKQISVTVSDGGSVNTKVMHEWILSCFAKRGNFLANTKSVLFMDSYGVHKKQDVVNSLKKQCNTEVVFIPPKTTSFLQPLDVAVNRSFKLALRNEWNQWLECGEKQYTNKGYRKRPSYQAIVGFVDKAVKSLSGDIIKKSFECCGIAERGNVIPTEKLNSKLKQMLEWRVHEESSTDQHELVLNISEEADSSSDDENIELVQIPSVTSLETSTDSESA